MAISLAQVKPHVNSFCLTSLNFLFYYVKPHVIIHMEGLLMNKKKELSPYERAIMKRIRTLIDVRCGGSQKKFVEKTGLNKGSVSQYCNGKNIPTWETAEKIAAAFNVDVKWVMAVDTIPDGVPAAEQQKSSELMNLYENADPEIQKAVMLLLKSAQHDS